MSDLFLFLRGRRHGGTHLSGVGGGGGDHASRSRRRRFIFCAARGRSISAFWARRASSIRRCRRRACTSGRSGSVRFCTTFYQTYVQASQILGDRVRPNFGQARRAVVVGAGGFVAAPVCLAGRRMGVPVALVNVDIVPGRANRLCGRVGG